MSRGHLALTNSLTRRRSRHSDIFIKNNSGTKSGRISNPRVLNTPPFGPRKKQHLSSSSLQQPFLSIHSKRTTIVMRFINLLASVATVVSVALAAGKSNVVDLTPENFDSVVLAGKPALVEFFAVCPLSQFPFLLYSTNTPPLAMVRPL